MVQKAGMIDLDTVRVRGCVDEDGKFVASTQEGRSMVVAQCETFATLARPDLSVPLRKPQPTSGRHPISQKLRYFPFFVQEIQLLHTASIVRKAVMTPNLEASMVRCRLAIKAPADVHHQSFHPCMSCARTQNSTCLSIAHHIGVPQQALKRLKENSFTSRNLSAIENTRSRRHVERSSIVSLLFASDRDGRVSCARFGKPCVRVNVARCAKPELDGIDSPGSFNTLVASRSLSLSVTKKS